MVVLMGISKETQNKIVRSAPINVRSVQKPKIIVKLAQELIEW